MKINKLIAVAVALGTSFAAFAQDAATTANQLEPVEVNDYWFAGIGGGMNFGYNGREFVARNNSGNGAGFAMDVYAGKWINNWAGFRAGYQGLSISDIYTDFGKNPFMYIHADALFRPFKWLVPYVHAGFMKIDYRTAAGGIGVALPINVSKRIAIIPDFKATAFDNSAFQNGKRFPGLNLSATLGLRFNLGKKTKYVPVPVVTPVETVKYVRDTVVITEKQVDTVYVRDIQEKEIEINTVLNEGIVLFDFDSYKLTEEAIPVLNDVAAWLKENQDVTVVVEGHTDYIGSDAYNQTLSENRANAVVKYLIEKGIDAKRLSSVGYGKTRPITDNKTPEARHRNRRIEFRLSE